MRACERERKRERERAKQRERWREIERASERERESANLGAARVVDVEEVAVLDSQTECGRQR